MPGSELFDHLEIEAVTDVLKRKVIHRYAYHEVRDGNYRVDEFEAKAAELSGAKHCLAVSSGTAALYVPFKAMGICPGDEIITSSFTFIATVEAILECGAVPVLGDVDESLNLSPDSAEDLITERTKAIMPVHMFGAAADMDSFRALGAKYGIPVVEDACQAMGGTYKGKALGTMGLWGSYSLDPNKLLTVGEGGLIVTDDDEIYSKMEYYHDHGHIHSKILDRGAEGKACLGFNFRMSELQGALGLVQAAKMQQAISMTRKTKSTILDAVKKTGLELRDLPDREGEIATQIVFLLPTPEKASLFQKTVKEAGAGCSILSGNTWHYAKHWTTLKEGAMYSRTRCPYDCPYVEEMPLYRPLEWERTEKILSRAVMFGLNIVMDDARVEKLITAIKAGAKAAL
ncbi:MAG: DegT/DnrJ/EryC1/StrS family aminotransferase [Synergistaceae bacterium]|nr:DegT/DnrJ/EryC1/StrS family aminotransferase [Synergistaceae bacterium]